MKIRSQTLIICILISAISIIVGRYVFPVISKESTSPSITTNSPVANSPVANSPVANSPVANSPVANSPVANSPEFLVQALYNNFFPLGDRYMMEGNQEELAMYFNGNLVKLILEERAYHEQTGSICGGPGYEPLSASQDPEINSIQVEQFDVSHNQVTVSLIGSPAAQLIYTFENTPDGWRIADIIFPDGQVFTESLKQRC